MPPEPGVLAMDLEAIKQRYDDCRELLYHNVRAWPEGVRAAEGDMEWLIAEIERLQAQLAAQFERRTFEFSCERCGRLLARVIVESSTLLLNGESQWHGRLVCEDCVQRIAETREADVIEAARVMNQSFQHGCALTHGPIGEDELAAWRQLNIALARLDEDQSG